MSSNSKKGDRSAKGAKPVVRVKKVGDHFVAYREGSKESGVGSTHAQALKTLKAKERQ